MKKTESLESLVILIIEITKYMKAESVNSTIKLIQEGLGECPVSSKEVKASIGISSPTLRELIKNGKIRCHKIGKRKTYFFLSEVIQDIKNG